MENKKMMIRIADLRQVINSIFDHIENDIGKEEVEISKEFYWEIPEKNLYLLESDPENFTMGSLIDDLELLLPLLSDKHQAVSLMLLHVAPLLRHIAFINEFED